MTEVSLIITLLLGLFIWKINSEHQVALNYYALTKNITQQLRSICNPIGASNRKELAKMRVESLEQELLPYLMEWRVAAEKFNLLFASAKHKYISETFNELLTTLKKAMLCLATERSPKEKSYEMEDILYGINDEFNKKVDDFLNQVEIDLKFIVHHPYYSYVRRLFRI